MAKLVLIVLMSFITTVVSTLPECKNCEVCVKSLPLRPNGCDLPSTLGSYPDCSVATACPCIDDISTLTAVNLVTGAVVDAQLAADGKITVTEVGTGAPVTDPVALVDSDSQAGFPRVAVVNGNTFCEPIVLSQTYSGTLQSYALYGMCGEAYYEFYLTYPGLIDLQGNTQSYSTYKIRFPVYFNEDF